jgi:hypothetical protein
VFSDRHVRKIAAGLWAGVVDHAEVAVEEDRSLPTNSAGFVMRARQDPDWYKGA